MPLPNHFDQDLAHLRQLQANLFATMQPILRKPRMLRTLHERLALALGHRALATCDIYAIAAKGEYYGAAMVQTRVQLDSCLCFFASLLVQDPDRFARRVLAKKQFNRMKDREGNTMADRYLARKLSRHFSPKDPWMSNLYGLATDFIHFSSTLMTTAEKEMADWDEALGFGDIDLANRETPKEHWVSSVRYFQGCTLAFTRLLREWLDSHDLG